MHAMKTKTVLMGCAVAIMGTSALLEPRVRAYPTTSPSAKAAVKWKFHPPANWIEHYLGDDRYKIKGGVWKVVTTENDTYYYPAWAPEMLRQKPALVIGFPNAAAAEEAGYLRSNYPMDSPLLGVTGREPERPIPGVPTAGANPAAGVGGLFSATNGNTTATFNAAAARRVVMSDGASSVLLPKGWTHIKQTQSAPSVAGRPAMRVQTDVIAPGRIDASVLRTPGKQRFIVFGFMDLPPGMNASALLSGNNLKNIGNAARRTGTIDSRRGNNDALRSGKEVSFGNVKGTSMTIPVKELGGNVTIYMGGKGSKLVLMADLSRGAKGAKEVVKSLRAK